MIKRDYLPKIIIRREDASRKTMEMRNEVILPLL
jgi:hypothetical protein